MVNDIGVGMILQLEVVLHGLLVMEVQMVIHQQVLTQLLLLIQNQLDYKLLNQVMLQEVILVHLHITLDQDHLILLHQLTL